MAYKNVGTIDGGVYTTPIIGTSKVVRTRDAVANGLAFVTSELEKIDPKIREPLASITWPRDIPVKTGGGWVEYLSAMGVNYGILGGGAEKSIIGNVTNEIPVIQADMSKEFYKTHVFSAVMRVPWIDVQRSKITGRSLEQLAVDGIRAAYDKHMDRNTYLGFIDLDSPGLLNQPNVLATNAANGAAGTATWKTKTPDEILVDINDALATAWKAAEYDLKALPNHILVPYEQFIYISTQKVSQIAEKTILNFLLENNMVKQQGGELIIAPCRFAKGAGAANTDRMMVYVNDDYFMAIEELVSLNRSISQVKTDTLSYDSVYTANISQVEIFYDQPIVYVDGI